MSFSEAEDVPSTRGEHALSGSALGATPLPIGERFRASPLVWDALFQEVLGSRNRQSHYVSASAAGCFDVHVLETLKVGVLHASSIFLVSTSHRAVGGIA